MAASMHESSSEDENEAKLREAVVDSSNFLINKNEVHRYNDGSNGKQEKRPSLRPNSIDKGEDDNNILNTTPGFRKHVSRKLSEIIDSQIHEVWTDVKCSCPSSQFEVPGIKLLAQSAGFLQTEDDEASKKSSQRKRKQRYSSTSSDSSVEDRLIEAAVSHDFIMKESRLLNESEADVILKMEESGNVGGGIDQNRSLNEKLENCATYDEVKYSSNNCKKKKKKKKKKEHDKQDETEDIPKT